MRQALALIAAGLLLALAAAALLRAVVADSRQREVAPIELPAVDAVGAAQRLAVAVTYPTVSRAPGDGSGDGSGVDAAALRGLHDFLADAFPRVHTALRRETVGDLSLLYTWPGRDPALAPALLLGHLDVVPVPPETEAEWSQPPFAGVIDGDGYIWGRGTIDDKVNVLGLLEAVEALLARGFAPARTVMLAFGHDEEIGGRDGAMAIAAALEARGVAPWLVLDEGAMIFAGAIPGIAAPVALIGVAEKGYVSLELTARAAGGHSSMPPKDNAIGTLASALTRLAARPMPARISGPTAAFYDHLAPEMSFGHRLLLVNRWLFAPLLVRVLSADPGIEAGMRTTTAPTLLAAGVKDNVLPTEARAVINFRIHPDDSVDAVEGHVRRAIDDPAIEVARVAGHAVEPSPVSPIDGAPYDTLTDTVREVFPGVLVTPFLVIGGTDARHYTGLTDAVYRFTPIVLGADDLARVHGIDERLGVDTYARAIAFYRRLIERVAR